MGGVGRNKRSALRHSCLAEFAARTEPKLAAYTHLVLLASKDVSPATISDLIAETRKSYDGPLEVGEDLMCFEIGQTVSVKRPPMQGSQSSPRRAQ